MQNKQCYYINIKFYKKAQSHRKIPSNFMHGLSNSEHFLIYHCQLIIQEITLQLPFSCQVRIQWGKPNHKAIAQAYCQITSRQSYSICIKEKLSQQLKCTELNQKLLNKQSIIKIIFSIQGKQKLGGIVRFNINQCITNLYSSGVSNYKSKIQNCPDSNAFIYFKLTYKFLREISGRSHVSKSRSSQNQYVKSLKFNTSPKKYQAINSNYQKRVDKSPSKFFQFPSTQKVDSQLIYKIPYNNYESMDRLKHQITLKQSQNQINIQKITYLQRELDQERLKNSQRLLQTINELNQSELQRSKLVDKLKNSQDQKRNLINKVNDIQAELRRKQQSESLKLKGLQVQTLNLNERIHQITQQNDRYKQEYFRIQSQMFDLQSLFMKDKQPILELQKQLEKMQVETIRLNRKIDLLQNQKKLKFEQQEIVKNEVQRLIAQKNLLLQKYNRCQNQRLKQREFAQTGYGFLHQKIIQKDAQLQLSENIRQNFNQSLMQIQLQKQKQNQLLRKRFQSACRKIQKFQMQQKKEKNYQSQIDKLQQNIEDLMKQVELKKQEIIRLNKQNTQKQLVFNEKIEQFRRRQQVQIQKLKIQEEKHSKTEQMINTELLNKDKQIQELRQKLMNYLTEGKKYNVTNFSSQRQKREVSNLKQELKVKQSLIQKLKVQLQSKNWTLQQVKSVNFKNNKNIMEHEQEIKDLKRKLLFQDEQIKILVSKNLQTVIQLEKQKSRDSINSKN